MMLRDKRKALQAATEQSLSQLTYKIDFTKNPLRSKGPRDRAEILKEVIVNLAIEGDIPPSVAIKLLQIGGLVHV